MDIAKLLAATKATSTTSAEKSIYIPIIDGVLKTSFNEVNWEIKDFPDLFVSDALIMDGTYVHALKGQKFSYILSGIVKDTYTEDTANAKLATLVFCSQISEGMAQGAKYIETIFGLKYLEETSQREAVMPSIKFKL